MKEGARHTRERQMPRFGRAFRQGGAGQAPRAALPLPAAAAVCLALAAAEGEGCAGLERERSRERGETENVSLTMVESSLSSPTLPRSSSSLSALLSRPPSLCCALVLLPAF